MLGCNFNINLGQTLAPGSSLCNTFGTKSLLHARTESSIIVSFMVKFLWQHNLPVWSYGTFKMPPGRLDAERATENEKKPSPSSMNQLGYILFVLNQNGG